LALWIEPRPDVKNGIREREVITMQNCFVPADILLPGAAGAFFCHSPEISGKNE